MTVKSFAVDVVVGTPKITEASGLTALFAAVQTATTDALAVSGLDAVTGATVAVTAIGTASAAVETALNTNKVTVSVNGTVTKAQLFAALDAIKAQINSSNVYA